MSIRSNVDARRFDQRVTFQRRTETQATTGDITVTWPDIITCSAAVDADRAGERNADSGIRSVGGYTVWIRADIYRRFALTILDRIVWAGRILNIRDMPDQQQRGRLVACICQTAENEG